MLDWGAIFGNAALEFISPTTAAYALAALGLAVHFGYTGLLNFGQAGFMAIGAYGYALSALRFGLPIWACVLIGIGASVIFALILGIPTLRLRADYLAIVTIAAAEIVRLLFTTNEFDAFTGSASGLSAFQRDLEALNPLPDGSYGFGPWNFSDRTWFFLMIAWVVVALCALLTWMLMRSPWGRVIKGIREDEDAVRSLGKNVYSYKMQSLILGGVFGTLAGMLFVFPRAVVPSYFQPTLTFFIYAILLLGGAATILGPIVGSMVFWVLLSFFSGFVARAVAAGWFPFMTQVQAGQLRFILVGVAIILIVVFMPQGILGNKKELAFVK
ncbi:branched-chain amino acid ABC transporter permease [Agromyces rhizosphaerae]|uniref:Branched-chain amino acid ABC transporter permease n=1 Tax=Agromyces rhizosphaerae TaxID=88374 RepID=A0A9W6CWD3_9MICO|nr:branched-chain amino acid ABC transporter permease [Agromyces rhizosphaerae]GLI28009.1 branched-chain amino acid ABC transporter permease [Agromyces rhizosphaerae]